MANFESIKTTIDNNIISNGRQSITGSMLNQVLHEMVDETESAIEVLETAVESHDVEIEDLQENKVEKGSYEPTLSVGLSDNLVDRRDVVASEFTFRATGGGSINDGDAVVSGILGNSVVWNQKARNVLDTTGAEGWWKRGDTQLSVDGNKIIMAADASSINQMSQKVGFIENHKYLIAFDVEVATELETIRLVILQSADLYGTLQQAIGYILQKDAQFASFYTASADMPYIAMYHQISLNEGDTTTFDGIKVIDLTLMFGAGNEPTTIEEFYKLIPPGIDLNAYNSGEVINMSADGIKSVGFNAWDEQWENGDITNQGAATGSSTDRIRSKNYIKVLPNALYNITTSAPNANIFFYDAEKNFISYVIGKSFTTPANCNYIKFVCGSSVYAVPTYNYDICINLAHTGYRNGEYQPYEESILDLSFLRDYFPNGMSSAGAAHDEIRYNKDINKWEKVVKVGAVKLKDLNWSRYQYQDKFSYFRAVANNYLPKCLQESKPNVLSVKYVVTSSCATSSLVDKSITHYHYDAGVILLRDDSFEDVESFKNSLSDDDVILCELATPVVTEIAEPLNLVYKVCDFGTEQMLSSQPSSAIITKTTYAFNAVDKIRENAREIEQLKKNGVGGGVSKEYVDGKLTELSLQVGKVSDAVADKVDATYVDNAINAAIGNVINGEY